MSIYLHDRTCECDLPVMVLTSWRHTNPARRFLVCPNRYKPVRKKCEFWDWYDPEMDSDWYSSDVHPLNPQQRTNLGQEGNREWMIGQLEAELGENKMELQKTLSKLTFWKSTFFAFAVCMCLILAVK
ncbi:hypothetical protein CTI12_AA158720 [Artemisia annua]|uniref:GRF-type domain-containing protein n=1 Tax=Artemisia annua TaxID=35608 RepID=A0A2U1PF39_ARTAN|nr:hypothetical protein CTI12_AA158720 [Artemisia annua]